jgi:uncharacterized protein
MQFGYSSPLVFPLLGLLLISCTTGTTGNLDAAQSPAQSPVAQSSAQSPAPPPTVQEDLTQVLPISAEAKIGDQLIQLEVARTPQEQSQGLMYRPTLPDDQGMLFPFSVPRPLRFWMMNTPEPLDMVFMLNGEVKAVINAPPCTTRPCPTYGPDTDVNQVIELRSGRAKELGLEVGDQVEIRFFEATNP